MPSENLSVQSDALWFDEHTFNLPANHGQPNSTPIFCEGLLGQWGNFYSESLLSQIKHLGAVIELLDHNDLKVKESNCQFAIRFISLLGHFADENGIRVELAKIKVIRKTLRPSSRTASQSFLDIAG